MIDHEKVKKAVELLLEGIGEDVEREGLRETPERIARMYEEIFSGRDEDPGQHLSKVFSVEHNDMVLEKDIVFYSTCEHHMMPFFGKAHVAYIPNKKVTGLSKLARTVEVFAKRLQIQEQMTAQMTAARMTAATAVGSRLSRREGKTWSAGREGKAARPNMPSSGGIRAVGIRISPASR